jgi:hypothetical protein
LNNAAATDYWLDVDTETEQNTKTQVRSRASGGLGDIYIVLSEEDEDGGWVRGKKGGLE